MTLGGSLLLGLELIKPQFQSITGHSARMLFI